MTGAYSQTTVWIAALLTPSDAELQVPVSVGPLKGLHSQADVTVHCRCWSVARPAACTTSQRWSCSSLASPCMLV